MVFGVVDKFIVSCSSFDDIIITGTCFIIVCLTDDTNYKNVLLI